MIRLATVDSHQGAPAFPTVPLDGIEAAAGIDNRVNAPPGTVGLRLHMPLCWRETWLGLPEAAQLHERVATKDELIELMNVGFEEARRLRVKYVSIRASHATWEGILTGRHGYTDFDVLTALAEWIFLAVGDRDMGFDVLFENTWHAGLRWNEPKLADQFLTKLRHPRAAFAFDLGNYLLTLGGTTTESQDLRKIKNFMKTMGPGTTRFKSVIVHRPGAAPVASDLVRRIRASTDPAEKERLATQFDAAVDAHQPWVSAPLKELFEIVQPAYLVHRLRGEGTAWAEAVKRQDGLVR